MCSHFFLNPSQERSLTGNLFRAAAAIAGAAGGGSPAGGKYSGFSFFFNSFNVVAVFLMAYLHPKTAKNVWNPCDFCFPLHTPGCFPKPCPKTSTEKMSNSDAMTPFIDWLWLSFSIKAYNWLLITGGNSFNKEIGTPGWQKPLTSFFTVSIPATFWSCQSCILWFFWW